MPLSYLLMKPRTARIQSSRSSVCQGSLLPFRPPFSSGLAWRDESWQPGVRGAVGAAHGNGRRPLSLLTAASSTVVRLRGCPAQRGDGPCLCSWGPRGPFPGTLGCTDPSSACRSDVGVPGTLTSTPRTLDVDVDVCTHASLVPQTWLSPALTYLCP